MTITIDDIISQIPFLEDTKGLTVKPLAGLTNTNYLVTTDNDKLVARQSGEKSGLFGIKREHELEVLKTITPTGIGPEIVRFFLPEGHLATRFIEGHHLSEADYKERENLARVVKTVKCFHQLPKVTATFSPFNRVLAYAEKVREYNVPYPEDFNFFLIKMRTIEADQQKDNTPWLGLCHNDLFAANILDDGIIRILDWEYAGMGDIYFDLATLVYAYEPDNPLPADLENYLLECYFIDPGPVHKKRLEGMKFMVLFFIAMWGLLRYGMELQGIMPELSDFDSQAYANKSYAIMRKSL